MPPYLLNHFPGETLVGSSYVHIPVGANTWPDPRVYSFFSQYGSSQNYSDDDNIVEVLGLDPANVHAEVRCLRIPDNYGKAEGSMVGETGPYWTEVSAGDFPWDHCAWPWSRHSYDGSGWEGPPCLTYTGPDFLFGDHLVEGTPESAALHIFPQDPPHQKLMLHYHGFDREGDRNELLAAIDDKCPGWRAHYEANRPLAHTGPEFADNWHPGHYVNLETGEYDNHGQHGQSELIRPGVPSIGLGNYSPFPSINAGRLQDHDFQAVPKRRIRFQTWSRWREWVPWTNFTPIIMNHLERWIMPGRVNNLKRVSVFLPKGVHAFGRGELTSLTTGGAFDENTSAISNSDLYFPKSPSDYAFPLRGMNQGCIDYYSDTGTADRSPFVLDEVPGHLSIESGDNGDDNAPSFPFGFDLSGTRKTLVYLLKRINPEIEIEWVLYPERDVGSYWSNGEQMAYNKGTASNNAGIFLGEIIYQNCAYGWQEDDYGNIVWNEKNENCLDFLDPYRVCTDGQHILYPNGYQAYHDNPVENHPWNTDYWNQRNDAGSEWFIPYGYGKYLLWTLGPGVMRYLKHLFPFGQNSFARDIPRASWMTVELEEVLLQYDMWSGWEKMLDTSLLLMHNWYETYGQGDIDHWTEPCMYTAYRPSLQLLYEKLYEMYPDLWTEVFDLDPYGRPLRTFNTRKYLVGYYDIINEHTDLVNVNSGDGINAPFSYTTPLEQRYIKATGPPPLTERYGDDGIPPTTTDLVGKMQHPDFGWGVFGEESHTEHIEYGGSITDYSSLTWDFIIRWWLGAAFYNSDANDSYNIEALLAKLQGFGMDLSRSVFSNNCGNEGGNLGCFPGESCECSDDEGELWMRGDCHYINEWDSEVIIDDITEDECTPYSYPGTDHWWEPYEDVPDECCVGEWEMFYGDVPVWDFNDEEIRAEIAAGPEGSMVSYNVKCAYPTFWDTLNYSCMSFSAGLMHWAHEKSRATVDFNHDWYLKYMLPVISFLWESGWGFGDGSGNVPEDSPWLVKNGGCIPFEGGNFEDGYVNAMSSENEYDKVCQMGWDDAHRGCYQNATFTTQVAGGLLCGPQEWQIQNASSTLWYPEKRITDFLTLGTDTYSPIPLVAYEEILKIHNDYGRQVLPEVLQGVTQRSKGGEGNWGFGPLHDHIYGDDSTISTEIRDNLLDGRYEVIDKESLSNVANIGTLTDGMKFGIEAFDPNPEDGDYRKYACGPPDAPYPCILRYVRPNTDIINTDWHGMTWANEGGEYKKLESISPRGVGKPIELVKGFNGHGSYNNHGYGNTFDFRYAYKVSGTADGDQNQFGWVDRVQLIHHSGKNLIALDSEHNTYSLTMRHLYDTDKIWF